MTRWYLISIVLCCLACLSGCTQSGNARHQKQTAASSPQISYVQEARLVQGSLLSGPQIFERFNSAVFMVFTSDGMRSFQGSGFFITSTGIAVSNYHVFEGTYIGHERIKLTNGDVLTVEEVIVSDKENDFIVFKVKSNGKKFKPIPISRRLTKVGEKVYAIGSPLGLENTFSSGEISQLRSGNKIQVSVPIDHGSSGGALINEYGEVIGITTGGRDDSGANLNYAISIDVIKPYL